MQICPELLLKKMFNYKYFCQTIQCPQKEGGRLSLPSDVSPTDVTRVKPELNINLKGKLLNFSEGIQTAKTFQKAKKGLQFYDKKGMIKYINDHLESSNLNNDLKDPKI